VQFVVCIALRFSYGVIIIVCRNDLHRLRGGIAKLGAVPCLWWPGYARGRFLSGSFHTTNKTCSDF
jgi:hypothetical protein